MPSLKEVKNRIASVKSTQQITRAMKMVAASKLRRAQGRLLQMRPYAQKLAQILQNVSDSLGEDVVNEYAVQREVKNVLLIVISSDRGLCGSFNSSIFRATRELISQEYSEYQKSGRLHILPVGLKGHAFFKKRDYHLNDSYKDLFSDPSFDHVKDAAVFAMDEFVEGKYDKVIIIYNEFKNVATQVLRFEQFLPITSLAQTDEAETEKKASVDYIFEPSVRYIVEELIPQSLKVQFYKAFLESNAAEHGARMTAMDKATDNAGELLKELRLQYNRTRQAVITKEILEIVAGAEALGG
jgi:F-type H+-transporting ATPase subunit gamma